MENEILVSICSITYNQAPYICQCLDGFLMQKTSFNYEIIIHDDCSTDGTAEIISEYAKKYPDRIVPILQTVNQYQNGVKRILTTFVFPKAKGKYLALCEGDDYWTDPQKLQRQVEFLESHPDYSMVCNRTKRFSERQNKYITENHCYNQSQSVDVKDIILKGGLFMATCSLLYRYSIMPQTLPDYWQQCHVGDYPLQIYGAMSGKVYYFNDAMSVYRVENASSWVGNRTTNINIEKLIATVKSEINMLNGFAIQYPQYKHIFKEQEMYYICIQFPLRNSSAQDMKIYLDSFHKEIKSFSIIGRIDLWLRSSRYHIIRSFRLYKFKMFNQKYQLNP